MHMKDVIVKTPLIIALFMVGCTMLSSQMPWQGPNYPKDIPATTAVNRGEEPGWTLWIPHHNNRNKWVAEKEVDLLMIGDSIIFEYARSAREVWDKYYGKRKAVNIASSGDQTQHMLWHFQNGGLDGMTNRNPKVVVLLIGTNNRGKPELAGQDTAAGILALLKEIHNKLPKSKIVLMALLPRGWPPDDKGRLRNNEVNAIIQTYADNKTVFWLDTGALFLESNGNLNRDLIKDGLHPSTKGYYAWAEAMEPTIKKLMGE